MDTKALREEFNPEPESRLDIQLAAYDILAERAEELRRPYVELDERLKSLKATANGEHGATFEDRASAAALLPVIRDALREARTAYQRAKGKADSKAGHIGMVTRRLRRDAAILEETPEPAGPVQLGRLSTGAFVKYSKEFEQAQARQNAQNYMAQWLEPSGERHPSAEAAMVREARAT